MSAFLRSSYQIGSAQFLRTLVSRRFYLCLALAHLPALAALAMTGFNVKAGPAVLAANLGWLMLLQILLPLVALIAGSAVLAEEIEDRTITYLFTRPIPRSTVMIGRWAAALAWLVVVMMSAVFFLLLATGRSTGKGPAIDTELASALYEAAAVGTVAYTALFAALGAFFKHPMLVGIGYAFAVEGFLANLPGKNQALTVQYYLRSLIADGAGPAWQKVEGFASSQFTTPAHAYYVLGGIVVSVLALGAWRLTHKQFALTS